MPTPSASKTCVKTNKQRKPGPGSGEAMVPLYINSYLEYIAKKCPKVDLSPRQLYLKTQLLLMPLSTIWFHLWEGNPTSALLSFLGSSSSSNFHTLLSQFPFASKFGSSPLACSFFAVGSHMYHKNSQENQTSYILNLLFLSLRSWPNSILCTVLQWFVQCWSSYTFECRCCILPIFTHHNTYMQWLTYNGCLLNIKVKF